MDLIKIILTGLIIICCLTVIVSFFIPWAKASVSVTKVTKGLGEQAQTTLKFSPFASKFIKGFQKTTNAIGSMGDIEVKTAVSGYDIPTMINKKSSRIALSLAQVMFKDTKDLDKKSLLVYLLPLLGICCIVLAVIGLSNIIPIIITAVISGIISIAGLYNLMTMDLSGLPIQITIEKGLWQTMYAYLLIFILSLVWIATDIAAAKKR